jgi:L-ascorbate metabolism protein UlaG (beta-lactamase superfamily)
VRLTARSSLVRVALAVAATLRRHGVRAVLTGGACASVHTAGVYASKDVDLIVVGGAPLAVLDTALATLGFHRAGDRYVHPRIAFYVEFPPGPLAIGADLGITPVVLRSPAGAALALSATDSCRDRLAAFYHWNDRQSLQVALEIASRHRVHMRTIRTWSVAEGHPERFKEFVRELERWRRAVPTRASARLRR